MRTQDVRTGRGNFDDSVKDSVMKTPVYAAMFCAAFALPLPVLAAGPQQHNGAGHYEWRAVPQFGPRANGPVQKRVWVPDAPAAGCDCAMMKTAAADCMQGMHGAERHSSAASAG